MKTSLKSRITTLQANTFSTNAVVYIFVLLCGMVTGLLLSRNIQTSGFLSLFENDLQQIAINGVGEYSFAKTFFNSVKFPALIFFFGFTAPGVVLTPLAVFLKGWLLSASISAVVSSFGVNGAVVAMSMFGIQTLIQIPCLVIIASFSTDMSLFFLSTMKQTKIPSVRKHLRPGTYLLVFSITLVLLVVISFLDVFFTPKLVSLSLKRIF